MEVHELEKWWTTVQKSIASRGLFVFRCLPLADTRVRSTLSVVWPHEQDAEAFLDLAQALGVRLIYAEAIHAPETNMKDPKAPPTLTGPLYSAGIAWVFEGVLHLCQYRTSWMDDEREHVELQQKANEEKTKKMAERLAHNATFGQVRGGELGRVRLARRMFPDVERYMLKYIVRDARVIFLNDIMPKKEEQLAEQARSLLATGMNKTQVANQLGLNRDRLSRILARSEKG